MLLEDIGRRRIGAEPSEGEALHWDELPTVRAPLGRVFGARSGDKGGNANIGLWARDDEAYDWLSWYLTAVFYDFNGYTLTADPDEGDRFVRTVAGENPPSLSNVQQWFEEHTLRTG